MTANLLFIFGVTYPTGRSSGKLEIVKAVWNAENAKVYRDVYDRAIHVHFATATSAD